MTPKYKAPKYKTPVQRDCDRLRIKVKKLIAKADYPYQGHRQKLQHLLKQYGHSAHVNTISMALSGQRLTSRSIEVLTQIKDALENELKYA